jgi:predicted ATP-dependent serine protease
MNKYTFTVSAPGQIEMKDVTNSHVLHVNEGHAKYEWLLSNSGRVITIAESGRWNSSKDYNNYYGAKTVQTSEAIETPVTVQLTTLADLNVDDSLFQPMLTGTIFDKFVSTDGGLLPATNVMAAGAPGVGKTTVLLEMLAKLQEAGKKVLFISAEMSEMDMARYMKRFPSWANLPILFLNNYDEQSNQVIEQTLNQGWDVVLTDSYTEVNDTVKDHTGWSRGKTEKWFLNLMTQHNKGLAKKFTTFITILQLSKGGQFVGSNKLKHMTSAMMNLDWDGKENSGRRYLEFSKNRMGEVGKKLYFSLNGGLTFDEARYQRDLFNDEILEAEAAAIEKEGHSFDRIFGLGSFTEEAVEASEE